MQNVFLLYWNVSYWSVSYRMCLTGMRPTGLGVRPTGRTGVRPTGLGVRPTGVC
jgi:hypothetical protein